MQITVITERPIAFRNYFLYPENLKRFFKKKISGHFAVTRSLLNGLKQLNIPHNFNPISRMTVHPNVIVLSDIDALKQYIEKKKEGRISQLFAGPNLVVRSNEYNSILASEYIDKVIVPSEWVKRAYIKDTPQVKNRIEVWAAGVNELDFTPSEKAKKEIDFLLYWKSEPETFVNEIKSLLKKKDFSFEIVKYGQYSHDQFKARLNSVRYTLFVSRSESQGLALAETWAMDVPTIVWDPGEVTINGLVYENPSSCPYLSSETGLRFKTNSELEEILSELKQQKLKFTPRAWVLNNMTDKLCAKNLINLFNRQ